MAYFIKVDEKEDLVWLTAMVQNLLGRYKGNISAYVEEAIKAERCLACFEEVREADSATLHHTAVVPKPRAKRSAEPEVAVLKLCEHHPAYGAKRAPRTDCQGCWDAYAKYNGPSKTRQAKSKFERRNGSS